MELPKDLDVEVLIAGTFLCHDAQGNVVQTIEIKQAIPASQLLKDPENDDQRSE